MKSSTRHQLNFFLVASGFILLVGLLIALFIPEIRAWRWSVVDRLLHLSREQGSEQQRYAYLREAKFIGWDDSVAIEALARYYRGKGETSRAIGVYQDLPGVNFVYLGNLALDIQDYGGAEAFFGRSNREGRTATGLAGEAVALYNLNKVDDGCTKSTDATKLDLSSPVAQTALGMCEILGGKTTDVSQSHKPGSDREAAYILINNKAFKPGEAKLLAISEKTARDWGVLARLAAARGEMKIATERAEQGIAIDRTDVELNKDIAEYYRIQGNHSEEKKHNDRYQQLLFRNYP